MACFWYQAWEDISWSVNEGESSCVNVFNLWENDFLNQILRLNPKSIINEPF